MHWGLDTSNYPSHLEGAMGDSISKSSSHDSNTKVSCSVTPSSDGFLDEKPFDIAIKEQPVTEERKPYVRKQDDLLAEAGTARANIAASKDSPNGTEDRDYTKKRSNQTVSYVPTRPADA